MTLSLAAFGNGGPITLALLLVGLVGLGVLAERVYVVVIRSRIDGRLFIERIIQLVRGGKVDDAIKQCAASTTALADIGLVILRSRSRDQGVLTNLAQAAALSVVPRLTHRIQYLPTLSLVAGLLGMLGMLAGVHDALLADAAAGAGHAAPFDTAVAAALLPPCLAIVIASVLMLGRSVLVSQSETTTKYVQEFSVRLINALVDLPDVRLGHR